MLLLFLKVIEKFRELGANVSTLTDYDKMAIVPTGCHGFCEQGVLVVIPELHTTYVKVHEEDVEEIFNSHLVGGKPVERLLYVDPKTQQHIQKSEDINLSIINLDIVSESVYDIILLTLN